MALSTFVNTSTCPVKLSPQHSRRPELEAPLVVLVASVVSAVSVASVASVVNAVKVRASAVLSPLMTRSLAVLAATSTPASYVLPFSSC